MGINSIAWKWPKNALIYYHRHLLCPILVLFFVFRSKIHFLEPCPFDRPCRELLVVKFSARTEHFEAVSRRKRETRGPPILVIWGAICLLVFYSLRSPSTISHIMGRHSASAILEYLTSFTIYCSCSSPPPPALLEPSVPEMAAFWVKLLACVTKML